MTIYLFVHVLYAAHIFITIQDVDDKSSVALLNIQRVHVCLIIQSKSATDQNQELLQALDDGLKWVLGKYINN